MRSKWVELPRSSEGRLWTNEHVLVKRVACARLRQELFGACDRALLWRALRKQGLPAPRVLRNGVKALWLEQPWLAGETLPVFLRKNPSSAALGAVFASAQSELQRVLALGVAHGDLSPENLLVSREGHGRWIDWSFAAPLGARARRASRAFMAPELELGGVLSESSELYSLGKVFEWAAEQRLLPREY